MTDAIVHSGSNNLPEMKSRDLVNSIAEAPHTAQQAFPNATVHYSPIIPKKVTESVRQCDNVNGWVRKSCTFNDYNFIQTWGLFVRDGDIFVGTGCLIKTGFTTAVGWQQWGGT